MAPKETWVWDLCQGFQMEGASANILKWKNPAVILQSFQLRKGSGTAEQGGILCAQENLSVNALTQVLLRFCANTGQTSKGDALTWLIRAGRGAEQGQEFLTGCLKTPHKILHTCIFPGWKLFCCGHGLVHLWICCCLQTAPADLSHHQMLFRPGWLF